MGIQPTIEIGKSYPPPAPTQRVSSAPLDSLFLLLALGSLYSNAAARDAAGTETSRNITP